MKKSLLSFLVLILCLPALFFCGCSKNSELPSISVKRYFESPAVTTIYDQTAKRNVSLAKITANRPDKNYMDSFVQYEFTGIGSWLYKMYIESIYFYVYTSNSTNEPMTITVSLTNTKKESDMTNTNTSETFTKTCSVTPKKNKATLCKIEINRTIATATATKLTIDILETASDTFFENGFKWMIYDFEIYGESRAYAK